MNESIRDIIKTKGRRHDWLAEQIGITPVRLSQLLSGERRWRVEEAMKLAEVLDEPMDRLFLPDDGKVACQSGNVT
jgi:plasmid maintenance system antidote protein VapI